MEACHEHDGHDEHAGSPLTHDQRDERNWATNSAAGSLLNRNRRNERNERDGLPFRLPEAHSPATSGTGATSAKGYQFGWRKPTHRTEKQ